MPTFNTHANKGRNLESVILASQGQVVTLNKISAGARWLPGGKAIAQKQFVDFVGCVNGSGRLLCFDAKQWGDRTARLDLVPPFQRELLARYHRAGAIAGLLIESTQLGRFFWFEECPCSNPLPWNSPALVDLGDNLHAIDWTKIPGVK